MPGALPAHMPGTGTTSSRERTQPIARIATSSQNPRQRCLCSIQGTAPSSSAAPVPHATCQPPAPHPCPSTYVGPCQSNNQAGRHVFLSLVGAALGSLPCQLPSHTPGEAPASALSWRHLGDTGTPLGDSTSQFRCVLVSQPGLSAAPTSSGWARCGCSQAPSPPGTKAPPAAPSAPSSSSGWLGCVGSQPGEAC